MKIDIPTWAMRRVGAEDYGAAQDAHRRDALQIEWPDLKGLRAWSKRQGWPTPWFGFEAAFLAELFDSQMNFVQAIGESGIELHIPRQEYTLSMKRLTELDALYEARSSSGQPVSWGGLVEELREIRRAVEAGVVIQVDGGPTLRSWQEFYEWAHGRYHMLEDGSDHWIGDDR
jgi:hypothetical protein